MEKVNYAKLYDQYVNENAKDYKVIGTYINNSTKITMKHIKCGYVYDVTPNHFKSGRRCPKCSGLMKLNIDKLKEMLYEKYKDEYIILSTTYINNKIPITVKHIKCGYVYDVTPNCLLRENCTRCPKCFPMKTKKTNEQFLKEVKEKVGDEYTFLEEYNGYKNKLKIRHNCNICNNYEYKVTPDNFLNEGTRCPKCHEILDDSIGVKSIEKYLTDLDILFEREFKIKDIYQKGKRCLRLDFYLTEYNIAIEFDGKQHFHSAFGSDQNEVFIQQQRDKRKNEYCKINNIPLLRIPYTDKNIEKTLENFLIENNVLEYIYK